MQPSFAVLLDAGFVRRRLGSRQKPAEAADFSNLIQRLCSHQSLQPMRLHRVYFYDAAPYDRSVKMPLGGGNVDYGSSPTAAQSKKLHASVGRLDHVALRFGELVCDGWKVRPRSLKGPGPSVTVGAADLKPNFRQKGVDMRIGLDIAALTLKKQVQVIVLVTADSDFVPAMKFARREGAQLFLATLGHGVHDQMRVEADLVIEQI